MSHHDVLTAATCTVAHRAPSRPGHQPTHPRPQGAAKVFDVRDGHAVRPGCDTGTKGEVPSGARSRTTRSPRPDLAVACRPSGALPGRPPAGDVPSPRRSRRGRQRRRVAGPEPPGAYSAASATRAATHGSAYVIYLDGLSVVVGGGRRRVAVLGGGMAGVATAWELSRPGWEERFESSRCTSAGGSSAGRAPAPATRDGRILEHGLHVWLGYYDNAFRLVRECYEELDRARTDPGCPIRTWRQAFTPGARTSGCSSMGGGRRTWVARASARTSSSRVSPAGARPGTLSCDAAPVWPPTSCARRAREPTGSGWTWRWTSSPRSFEA